jgi:hypothetical protein
MCSERFGLGVVSIAAATPTRKKILCELASEEV